MGTTTFYLRHNDFGARLQNLKKKEREKFDKLSPYSKDNHFLGWRVPLELHNGNVYVLVFWKGKLMKMEDAPQLLSNKYYNKYQGKFVKEYEWILLKKLIENSLPHLDKEFRKRLRKKKKEKPE